MSVTGVEAMNGFTPEQWEAIERRGGALFLDAGAGSGKTSVLVERFARGVLEDGLDPAAILTITFTDKAAAEMRERIRARRGTRDRGRLHLNHPRLLRPRPADPCPGRRDRPRVHGP